MIIQDPLGRGGNARVIGNRLQSDSNTTAAETVAAENGLKWSVSTGKVALTTGASAFFIINYTGSGQLIIPSNAFLLVNTTGTATDVGEVLVEANPQEGTGTFTTLTTFNWLIGSSKQENFTAKSGAQGNTFTSATQEVTGFFELPVNVVANTDDFVMGPGSSFGITVTPPPGITASTGIFMMNVYEILAPSLE